MTNQPVARSRRALDHAGDAGFVVRLPLVELDARRAEYTSAQADTALSVSTEAFVGMDRPGTVVVQVGDAAAYDRMVAAEQDAAAAAAAGRVAPAPDMSADVADLSRPDGYATVILFKPSGKYYSSDVWPIPTELTEAQIAAGALKGDLIGPYAMRWSSQWRRINGGAVLIPTQEPWGYPHLIPGDGSPVAAEQQTCEGGC